MMSMYNCCDDTVHYQRRKCSTSPAVGVQLERYIHKDGILDGRDATIILTYYAKTSTGYTGTLEEYVESIKETES